MNYIIHVLFFYLSFYYFVNLPVEGEHGRKHRHDKKSVNKRRYKTENYLTPGANMERIDSNKMALRQGIGEGPDTSNKKHNESEYSSERDNYDVEKEFNEGLWLHKQFEALNSSTPRGDVVNMLAVRPWGVPCGDPNMFDMATGTCTLPTECEPALRIYRGDHFCKKTTFVCCGILEEAYNMDIPFDVSFAGSSFETDLEEAKEKYANKHKKKKDSNKRQIERDKRKTAMKSLIDKIVKEVRKIINKAQHTGHRQKMKKKKQLKQFLLDLKNQYKKDRQAVRDVHEVYQIEIDANLRKKLIELKDVYRNFMQNETFRNIILSGSKFMSKRQADMLVEAYPELRTYIAKRRDNRDVDNLSYDIEYGLMYY